MSADHLKTPLALNLPKVVDKGVRDAIRLTGKALPASIKAVVSSGIVTIQFDVDASPWTLPNITVPVGFPEYIRIPWQIGDKGVVFPADVRLATQAGLGASTLPKIDATPANLSALTFFPLGSANWTAADDPNSVVVYGPDGVILRNTASTHTITLNTDGIVLDNAIRITGDEIGFLGTSPVAQQTIIGPLSSVVDPSAKTVLTSIIGVLVAYGLAVNGTT